MPKTRIGLFGGTFDPPHIGHLILATEACRQFDLTKLLWVLTPDPPHKKDQQITLLEHRLAMVERTIVGNSCFELSRIEIDRPGPHFTIDTVELIKQQTPQADIVLLLGGDSLRDLPKWHRNSELVSAVHQICVMQRTGDSFDLAALNKQYPQLNEKLSFIDTPRHGISSRDIRRRVFEKQPYRDYIVPSVYEYIVEKKLYTYP